MVDMECGMKMEHNQIHTAVAKLGVGYVGARDKIAPGLSLSSLTAVAESY